jgi:lysine 6-dehydrogenase
MPGHKYVVIGGAGAMGKITVRDLFETSSPQDEVIIADYDFSKASALAKGMKSSSRKPSIVPIHVDVRDSKSTAKALQDAFVVINSTQYQLNLEVMHAALRAKAHYIDLGGLFHMTRKQLELDGQFKAIKRTALIGMGAAPGITNILSRYGADQLDRVTEIHTRVASLDQTQYIPKPALAVSYSLQTILEEFSFKPAVYTRGKFKFVEPMSGDEPLRFPAPIGLRKPMYTIHSEVATLPLTFASKGVKEVSFKIAFDPEFTDRVRFLVQLGLGSHDPIDIQGVQVRPIDVIHKIAMNQPSVKQKGRLKQYEIVRAIVKGTVRGKKITWVNDCHTQGMPEWGIGLDIDTGSPPAITAQMLATQEISEHGVVPPEIAVPPAAFFERLKLRKMKIKSTQIPDWDLKT